MRASFGDNSQVNYSCIPNKVFRSIVKVKVSHSLIAVGAVGIRVALYLGHS